jgi:hypothetical protein
MHRFSVDGRNYQAIDYQFNWLTWNCAFFYSPVIDLFAWREGYEPSQAVAGMGHETIIRFIKRVE